MTFKYHIHVPARMETFFPLSFSAAMVPFASTPFLMQVVQETELDSIIIATFRCISL